MKRMIQVCTWLALASVIGIYGCSGEDDPAPTPSDMSDGSDESGGGSDGGDNDDGDGNPEPDPAGIVQGDPCTDDGEACAAGLFCVDGVCCNEACDGVCESCRGDISGGFNGTCTSLPAGDEIVIEAEEYEDCPGIQTCDGQGACFARAAGESCDSDSQCGSGFCTDGVCCDSRCGEACESCATGTCLAVTSGINPGTCESQCTIDGCTGIAVGEPCELDTDCGSGICDAVCVLADGNVCGANSECLNSCIASNCQTVNGSGEACDEADPQDCESGLACLNSTCLIPSGSSRTCADADECEESLCLNGSCSPQLVEGDECGDDAECAGSLVCRPELFAPDGDSVCLPAIGNYCGPAERCESGTCIGFSFREQSVCRDETSTVTVAGGILLTSEDTTVSAVVECVRLDGSVAQSSRIELSSASGETVRAATPPVACSRGGVVRLTCDIIVGKDNFRLANRAGNGDPEIGDTIGPSFVTRNLPNGGGTVEVVARQSGAAVCFFFDDN